MKKFAACLVLLLIATSQVNAQVVFEDSFDNTSDWHSPTQQLSYQSDMSDSSGSATTRGAYCPPDGPIYSGTFTQRSAFSADPGYPGMIISSANARGGAGKALTMWHEPIDTITCDGGTYWCSGEVLAAMLDQNYNELYIRFYVKFQSDWRWDDNNAGQLKFFRVAHYWGSGSQFQYGVAGNAAPIIVFDFHDTTGDGYPQFAVISAVRFQASYRSGAGGGCMTSPNPTYLVAGDFEPLFAPGGTGLSGNKLFNEWMGDDEWHQVDIYLKGNSGVGVEDGVYRVSIDGVDTLNRTNVAWADEGTCDPGYGHQPPQPFAGWNFFALGGNLYNRAFPEGTQIEQWYAMDDVVISTTPIPDNYVIGTSVPDTVSPSIPTNLAASAISTFSITLTWSASTDNVGVAGYKVYRDGPQVATTNLLTYTNTALTLGTTYNYQIAAFDSTGNVSGRSTTLSVQTLVTADVSAPSVPASLATLNVTTSSITLTWAASTDNVGVSGYKIYRGGVQIATASATTNYTNTGLSSGVTYNYQIAAYDIASNVSALSTTLSVKTLTDLVVSTGSAIISAGDTWKYFKGTQEPPADWRSVGFDDSSWLSGPSGLGCGDGDDATYLADMENGYISLYIRKAFISDFTTVNSMSFSIDYDDGFVAYLNGTEIARRNVTGTPVYSSGASTGHESGVAEVIDITAYANLLINGTNVLSIHGLNSAIWSSDFSLIPALSIVGSRVPIKPAAPSGLRIRR